MVAFFETYGSGYGKDGLVGVLYQDMGLSEPFMFLILKGRHSEELLKSFFELILVGIANMRQFFDCGQRGIQVVHDILFGLP